MAIRDDLQSNIKALERYQTYERALQWCRDNGKKDKAAIATGLFEGITAKGLRLRRTGQIVNGEEYADRRILTTVEEVQLAKWIKSEARAHAPKTRDQVRLKVVEILQHRRRTRKCGRRYLPLSACGQRVVADQGVTLPCDKWFREFYDTYSDVCVEKKAQREDRDRAAKCNEGVVQNHFYNPEGD